MIEKKSKDLEYQIDLYEESPDRKLRFVLGKSGRRPLVGLGLNPSTADEHKPDMTLSKLMGFAERHGFDGFIMLNLYPKRATFPSDLPKRRNMAAHQANLNAIRNCMEHQAKIHLLAAWGTPILQRPYLKKCLLDIHRQLDPERTHWLQIGFPTKSGHPRHPSRAAYDLGLNPLSIEPYLKSI